jgi:uncharacterized protein YuzE
VNIRYDRTVDVAYISLLNEGDATAFGFTYACDPSQIDGQINLDFDVAGRLKGIEVLQATKMLPAQLLANAS